MGFFNPPPTNTGQLPDIPIPDFVSTGKQIGQGVTQSSLWDDLVNKFLHALWDGVVWAIREAVSGMDSLLALAVEIVTTFQGNQTPGFYKLVGAVIGDLLGVPVPPSTIQEAMHSSGLVASMQVLGGDIFNVLKTEFSTGQIPGSMTPSEAPASAFLGFLASFAIRQGNVAFISEFLPVEVNVIAGLREYGELLAKNLGLGRLARRALTPLMDILVANPLKLQLNQTYRPTIPNHDVLIRAFNRGLITRGQLDTWLAWQGFSDQIIPTLIADSSRPFRPIELVELQRLGQMDDATAISLLQQEGMDQGTATLVWDAVGGQTANGIIHQQATVILSQQHQGLIDAPTARGLLDQLPLTPREKLEYAHLIGVRLEYGWRALSESEMERAFLGGIIDISTIQDYWRGFGYAPGGIQTLTLLLLQKQAAGNRTAGGHTPHKNLTEAELEKAFKLGILTLPQLQAQWTALGYSANSIQILTALVTAPPAA